MLFHKRSKNFIKRVTQKFKEWIIAVRLEKQYTKEEIVTMYLNRFDFLHWFEGIVVSGEEQTRKPFPEIYTTTLNRFGFNAQESLFIDDNLRNVEAAEALGIFGHHFKSPMQLQQFLEQNMLL